MGKTRTVPSTPGLTLDAGALLAIDRGDGRMIALLRQALAEERRFRVPAGVVGQAWRDGRRQAVLARFLRGAEVDVIPLDDLRSLAAGPLCGAAGGADVIDASIVLVAREHHDTVVTGDPSDLRRLDAKVRIVALWLKRALCSASVRNVRPGSNRCRSGTALRIHRRGFLQYEPEQIFTEGRSVRSQNVDCKSKFVASAACFPVLFSGACKRADTSFEGTRHERVLAGKRTQLQRPREDVRGIEERRLLSQPASPRRNLQSKLRRRRPRQRELPRDGERLLPRQVGGHGRPAAQVRGGGHGHAEDAAGGGRGRTPEDSGSGWRSAWNGELAKDTAALKETLKCYHSYQTWTDTPGSNENKRRSCRRSSWISPGSTTGKYRCSLPPDAAYIHSASVAMRPPSQTQNANAVYRSTQGHGVLAQRKPRIPL